VKERERDGERERGGADAGRHQRSHLSLPPGVRESERESVCVFVRERLGETGGDRERAREREVGGKQGRPFCPRGAKGFIQMFITTTVTSFSDYISNISRPIYI